MNFDEKNAVIASLWIEFRKDEDFADFMTHNDLGCPLAYMYQEKLITEPKDFGSSHIISDKLAIRIFQSEIVKSLLDWIDRKKEADERAQLRKLNKND